MPSTDNERAAIPLYKEGFTAARARNDTEIAAASIKMNDLYAKDISETINANYSDNILDTDKIVEELIGKYGAERLAYILAARITKLNLRKTTYERMKQLSKRIYPAIGYIKVDKLTSRKIQQFISDLALNGKNLQTGKPLSRKTVVHHFSFISDVLSYAVRMEMIHENPIATPYQFN